MLRISTLLILVGAASAFFIPTPAGVTHRHSMQCFANAYSEDQKAQVVEALLKAKKESGLTFDDIAEKTGLTNAYVAQLFYRQAHLKDETAKKLAEIMPLSPELIEAMKEMPFRTYDRDVIRVEPLIYRLEEAVLHYGQGIKAIVNEKFGDGIMSAIDVKIKVDKVKGKMGEDRVVITMNGKYLPHIEHIDE